MAATDTTIPWTVSLKDNTGNIRMIPALAQKTQKLEIYTNTDNLFTSVHWVLSAESDFMDAVEGMNFSIGTSVWFDFYPSLGGSNAIRMEFRVLSVNNGPGMTASTLGTDYSIVLTSPWYFEQSIGSKSYRGTASEIMEQTATELKDYFTEIRVQKSVDGVATRYRTLQNQGAFLKERVQMYHRGDLDSSSYMFTNTDNSFEVLSYQDMKRMSQYTAIDMSSKHIGAFKPQMDDTEQQKFMLYPIGVVLAMNDSAKNSLWNISAPSLVYWLRDSYLNNTLQLKKSNDSPRFRYLGNDGTKKFSYLTNRKDHNKITKVYIDESMQDLGDAYTVALNDYQHDLQSSHKLELVCLPNLFTLAGRLCYYYISRSNDSPSVFAQTYVITGVTHVFEGIKARTVVTLKASSFNYSTETDIGNLYHTVPVASTTNSRNRVTAT